MKTLGVISVFLPTLVLACGEAQVRLPVPPHQCPKCLAKRILGPRVVKDKQKWCNCYDCGHEWQVDKPRVRKGDKPSGLSSEEPH